MARPDRDSYNAARAALTALRRACRHDDAVATPTGWACPFCGTSWSETTPEQPVSQPPPGRPRPA